MNIPEKNTAVNKPMYIYWWKGNKITTPLHPTIVYGALGLGCGIAKLFLGRKYRRPELPEYIGSISQVNQSEIKN